MMDRPASGRGPHRRGLADVAEVARLREPTIVPAEPSRTLASSATAGRSPSEEKGVREITNQALTLADIPGPDADWTTIGEFALTFSGYKAWGSFERCAEIANAPRHESLTDLRTCLFFEQRRWHHYGDEPDPE